MEGDVLQKRQRANRLCFPAAEPEFRAARQRCAESCAKYNSQAEFASPEKRARLWQEIVAPRVQDLGTEQDANESQIENNKTIHHKLNGKSDPRPDITDDEPKREAFLENGSAAAEPASSHSSAVASTLKRLPLVSTSPEGRPAVTPPPSPEYKDNRSRNDIGDDEEGNSSSAEDFAIADTPPPSRKSSLRKLSPTDPTHDSPSDLQEHDPAITNPFIVNAPYVKPPVFVDYGTNLHIGNGTFINRNFVVIDSPVCHIRIGERCLFGPNVILAAVEHPLDAEERISPIGAPSYASSIEIGDECWIAAGVKILCGVKIGSGCVIGAGSVVTKDIPNGCIAYGNPARVSRVCSPRFQPTGIAIHSPSRKPDLAQHQERGQDSGCSNGCSFRCSASRGLLQRGKDTVLLLIGLVSLVHLIKHL